MKLLPVFVAAALGAVAAAPASAGAVLDSIKSRGHLLCGVNTSAPGFSSADSQASGAGSTSTSAVRSPPPFWATAKR